MKPEHSALHNPFTAESSARGALGRLAAQKVKLCVPCAEMMESSSAVVSFELALQEPQALLRVLRENAIPEPEHLVSCVNVMQ